MNWFKLIVFFISVVVLSNCASSKVVRKNGGIQYQETSQTKEFLPYQTLNLPDKLEEISGLLTFNNTYLGFNDSGGEPEVYQFSNESESKIIKTMRFKNVKNVDFESIAISDTHIFVGDFGNNLGNRKDLRIYYFEKSILNDDSFQEIDVEVIKFSYPEQTDFSVNNRNHDFDCEAMYFHNGKLHLFTKEWKRFKTHHYSLEVTNKPQKATLLESFDTGFLVTGADAITKGNKTTVAFVGYTLDGRVHYIQNQIHKSDSLVFKNAPKVYFLGSSIELGQVEGVILKSDTEFCTSAERFGFKEQKVKEHVSCYKF